MASSSQLSHSATTASTNSRARAYLSVWSGWRSSPKLAAARSVPVVTMFHPARPPERWSRLANSLARL
ncbi:Uncharacterised protein [Mycobacteroides abscessus subsp. abscessus]|nr:Uncharacterised protein [Mycobacteroides abscessus subsp. abscessus]